MKMSDLMEWRDRIHKLLVDAGYQHPSDTAVVGLMIAEALSDIDTQLSSIRNEISSISMDSRR